MQVSRCCNRTLLGRACSTRAAAAPEPRPRSRGSRSGHKQQGQRERTERRLGAPAAAAATPSGAPTTEAPAQQQQQDIACTPQRSISVLNRYRALLLDSTYRPVGVANWQRAVCLDLAEKADVLEYFGDATVRSASDEFFLPAVMRVKTPRSRRTHAVVSLNRANVLLRDGYTCQYCGFKSDLTLDHVVPQSKGGQNSWDNLVACCTTCNGKKGDKSLQQLGWRLRKHPKEPSVHEMDFLLSMLLGSSNQDLLPPEWQAYIVPFSNRSNKQQRAS